MDILPQAYLQIMRNILRLNFLKNHWAAPLSLDRSEGDDFLVGLTSCIWQQSLSGRSSLSVMLQLSELIESNSALGFRYELSIRLFISICIFLELPFPSSSAARFFADFILAALLIPLQFIRSICRFWESISAPMSMAIHRRLVNDIISYASSWNKSPDQSSGRGSTWRERVTRTRTRITLIFDNFPQSSTFCDIFTSTFHSVYMDCLRLWKIVKDLARTFRKILKIACPIVKDYVHLILGFVTHSLHLILHSSGGFRISQTRAPIPEECVNLLFAFFFFTETAQKWIWKEFGLRMGSHPWAPSWIRHCSQMNRVVLLHRRYIHVIAFLPASFSVMCIK